MLSGKESSSNAKNLPEVMQAANKRTYAPPFASHSLCQQRGTGGRQFGIYQRARIYQDIDKHIPKLPSCLTEDDVGGAKVPSAFGIEGSATRCTR